MQWDIELRRVYIDITGYFQGVVITLKGELKNVPDNSFSGVDLTPSISSAPWGVIVIRLLREILNRF